MSGAGPDPGRNRVFFDSLVVTRESFLRDLEFLERIARKMLRSTHAAANRLVAEQELIIGGERQKAINAFLWWGNGDG